MNTLLLLTCLLLEIGQLLDTREQSRARRTPPAAPQTETNRRTAEAIERFNDGIAGILGYDAQKGRDES